MPTIHSSPSRMSMKQQVVPRSGSSMTSPANSKNPGSSGRNRCRARRKRRRAVACGRAGRHPRAASPACASSDGCTCNGPRSIHRGAPKTPTPMPGTSTATSVASASATTGYTSSAVSARGEPHREPEQRDADREEHRLLDHLAPDRAARTAVARRGDRCRHRHQDAEAEQPEAGQQQQLHRGVRPIQEPRGGPSRMQRTAQPARPPFEHRHGWSAPAGASRAATAAAKACPRAG